MPVIQYSCHVPCAPTNRYSRLCVCVLFVVCVCACLLCVSVMSVCACVGQERKTRLEEEVGVWEKKHHATSEDFSKLSAAAAGI